MFHLHHKRIGVATKIYIVTWWIASENYWTYKIYYIYLLKNVFGREDGTINRHLCTASISFSKLCAKMLSPKDKRKSLRRILRQSITSPSYTDIFSPPQHHLICRQVALKANGHSLTQFLFQKGSTHNCFSKSRVALEKNFDFFQNLNLNWTSFSCSSDKNKRLHS